MTARGRAAVARTVTWGGREIPYTVAFGRRRRLAITVHPDLRVEVLAPEGHPVEAVEQRVRARRAWIAKQLRDLERFHPHPASRQWVSGETHWYLGRQYRLRVYDGAPDVWRAGGRLHVRAPTYEGSPGVERVARTWYAVRAREVFGEHLDRLRAKHPRLRALRPSVRVLWMERRWGSCSARGTISLNVELVKSPPSCIEYVIVHELCHMIEARHSTRFFRLMSTILPDWRQRRQLLERTLR
ncbi:MAG: SprT family zinc-dependent metalloprotease [Gemmatimonadaceae bacterium]